MTSKKQKEPDWKAIAAKLKEGLVCAISFGKFTGCMIDTSTMEMEGIYKYLADRLEAYPGVTVDRELLGLTKQQRNKALRARKVKE